MNRNYSGKGIYIFRARTTSKDGSVGVEYHESYIDDSAAMTKCYKILKNRFSTEQTATCNITSKLKYTLAQILADYN